MSFVLIQLMGFVPSILIILAQQKDSRAGLLKAQFVGSMIWIVHYALLGAYTGVATNALGLVRAVMCYYNDRKWAKSPLWLAFFILCYAASPLLTWGGMYCLLLGAAMVMTTVALWVRSMRVNRLLFLLNSPLVLAYNLFAHSYSCAVVEAVALVSFAAAVWRFDIHPQLTQSTKSNHTTNKE